MKKTVFILLGLVGLFFSCKKNQPPKQFSYWYVNSDSFASNNVVVEVPPHPHGAGETYISLSCKAKDNSFVLTFNTNELPTTGSIPMYTIGDELDTFATVAIYYNNVFYLPSHFSSSTLSASILNSKPNYTLQPTWFINYQNINDSVLVHGIFNQP